MTDPDIRAKDPGLNTRVTKRKKISEDIAVTRNQSLTEEDIALSALIETIKESDPRNTRQIVTPTRNHLKTD